MKTEKEHLEYIIECCENILGKQVEGVGYPDCPYGLTPPVLQLMKMRQEVSVRLENLPVSRER